MSCSATELEFPATTRNVAALDGIQVHFDYDRNGNRLHESVHDDNVISLKNVPGIISRFVSRPAGALRRCPSFV